jgi:hypothetical protein
VDLSPALILNTWVSGIAAGGALVVWWRVVGPGYVSLIGAIVAVIGGLGALAGAGPIAWAGVAAGVVGVIAARSRIVATVAFAAGSVFFAVSVWQADGLAIALLGSGILLLGGITSEMLLGHWFLVDPTLPRWALHVLDAIAAAGLGLEVVIVTVSGSLVLNGVDGVYGIVYLVMVAFCLLLMGAVWGSLREPRYSGVMAATGLSYLAVLVAFGVVTIGRSLAGGGS